MRVTITSSSPWTRRGNVFPGSVHPGNFSKTVLSGEDSGPHPTVKRASARLTACETASIRSRAKPFDRSSSYAPRPRTAHQQRDSAGRVMTATTGAWCSWSVMSVPHRVVLSRKKRRAVERVENPPACAGADLPSLLTENRVVRAFPSESGEQLGLDGEV